MAISDSHHFASPGLTGEFSVGYFGGFVAGNNTPSKIKFPILKFPILNDGIRDGEFHLELQGRIASGVQPRILAGFTCDLYYGAALQEAAGLEQGYRKQVSKLTGFYRILAATE